ncbi:22290_t:CDS:2 [Gigaspora rosea]|nr:22290_t:CDS:2 [Gigaspora rosea]
MATSEMKILHTAKTPAYDEGTKYATTLSEGQTTAPTYDESKHTTTPDDVTNIQRKKKKHTVIRG